MKPYLLLCFLAVTGLLIGCSSGPSDRQARTDLQKWFDTRWPDAVRVMTFEALRTTKDEHQCVIAYQATARFVKDMDSCVWSCCGEVCFEKRAQGFKRWITKASEDRRTIRSGDQFEIEGTRTYTRAGNAWSGED